MARVSSAEEANNDGYKESKDYDPNTWRVLPMLIPPWSGFFSSDKGCFGFLGMISWHRGCSLF